MRLAALAALGRALRRRRGRPVPDGAAPSAGYVAQIGERTPGVLEAARPVPEVIADPTTPEALRQRLLALSQQMRDFAGDRAGAARQRELPARNLHRNAPRCGTWWPRAELRARSRRPGAFPVVGCVGYRGYF